MAHTPNPWKFETTDSGDNVIHFGKHDKIYVLDMEECCGECLSNYQLIAVAPSLLEACELTRKNLSELVFGGNVYADGLPQWFYDWVQQIEAVIAKAKGQG